MQKYWSVDAFTPQLAELCRNRIWIDRLITQPMASCTIAFVDRCGKIAPDSDDKDTHFRIHGNITDTLQRLYEDLQNIVASKNGSKDFKYHHRYKRLRGFDGDGNIIAGIEHDDGLDTDSDGSVLVEEDQTTTSLRDLALNDNDVT